MGLVLTSETERKWREEVIREKGGGKRNNIGEEKGRDRKKIKE